MVHSRCSTLVSYPGSSGCGHKGQEVECRLLSGTLCFLSCSCPKQVCSEMSLPSLKHVFLFARTFHSLCLLLLKGHGNGELLLAAVKGCTFPWMLYTRFLAHSPVSKGMDNFFTCPATLLISPIPNPNPPPEFSLFPRREWWKICFSYFWGQGSSIYIWEHKIVKHFRIVETTSHLLLQYDLCVWVVLTTSFFLSHGWHRQGMSVTTQRSGDCGTRLLFISHSASTRFLLKRDRPMADMKLLW